MPDGDTAMEARDFFTDKELFVDPIPITSICGARAPWSLSRITTWSW
jgi:hypothetical protein